RRRHRSRSAGRPCGRPSRRRDLVPEERAEPHGTIRVASFRFVALRMEHELTCPRCSQPLSREDSVIVAPDGTPSHLDCRAPRALSGDERYALAYCAEHAVADCVRCRRSYREADLVTGYLRHLCPSCRQDLTESIRAHLDACTIMPEDVRRRARAVRAAAEKLVKQSNELADHADVLMREAEATIAALRD